MLENINFLLENETELLLSWGGGGSLELVCPLFPEVTRKSALTLTAQRGIKSS